MKEKEIRKQRLAEIVDKFKSVAEFARTYDLDVTYIRQLLSGYRQIGEKSARNLEQKIGLPRYGLDQAGEEILEPTVLGGSYAGGGEGSDTPDLLKEGLGPAIQTPLRPVRAIDNPDEAEHDILQVPRYTLRASCGTGEPVFDVDELGEPNYARRSWAKKRGLNPDNLFSIVAVGDSMEPEISDGDSLIVHRQAHIEDNKLMVICYRGECYVKRVLRQFDGALIVKSTNPDYQDVKIIPDQAEELHVVGRVVSITRNA